MWVSKKKWKSLEQRVTNLERVIQRQITIDPVTSKELIKGYLCRFQGEAICDSAPKSS